MGAGMQFWAMSRLFRSRTVPKVQGIETLKCVEFIGINGLAVRLQKPFYEATFKKQIKRLQKINIFVEPAYKLLPTLGRSANLNEPGAPR